VNRALDIAVALPILAGVVTLGVAALPACALAVFRVETAIYRGRNDGPY
jgi:hypothetical protein